MIQGAAKTLGLYLHGITLKELAIHKMEQVLDDSTFSDKSSDDAQTAKDISSSISNKLEKYKLLIAKSFIQYILPADGRHPQPRPVL